MSLEILPLTSLLHWKHCEARLGRQSLCPIDWDQWYRLPSRPKQTMKGPQTAVSPLLGLISACDILTMMVCWDDWLPTYPPPVQTLVVSIKGRQQGYSLWTDAIDYMSNEHCSVYCASPQTQSSHRTIRTLQLAVALPSFVWDGWGGDHDL